MISGSKLDCFGRNCVVKNEDNYDWRKDYCAKDGFTRLKCRDCGHAINIQSECNLSEIIHCRRCKAKRQATIVAKAFEKYRQLPEKRQRRRLFLWTLGTSLKASKDNWNALRRHWKLFIRYYKYRYPKFNAWLRCFESGKKGEYLHIHFITPNYIPHSSGEYEDNGDVKVCSTPCKHILCIWRAQVGEVANVNYKGSVNRGSAGKAFAYVAKYAAKGFKYYWMGEFTQVKFMRRISEHDYRYIWTFEEGYHSMYQNDLEGNKIIHTNNGCRAQRLFQEVP